MYEEQLERLTGVEQEHSEGVRGTAGETDRGRTGAFRRCTRNSWRD